VSIDEAYDEATVAAIDRWGRAPRRVPAEVATGWRRGVGGAAIAAAAMLGAADVIEPKREEAIIEEIDVDDLQRDLPVTVRIVPGVPRLTRAIVRPWLFPR
jgi:hypothetical protein